MPDVTDTSTPTRHRNVLIPVGDGVVLAGDLRLPQTDQPVPVLVTYIPYRKDDFLAASFEHHNDCFARAGYAVLVVDLRGLGASSGVVGDALDGHEGDDAAAVVEWAATQPWCTGKVGMWGVSYGAITAFRTAARRPPHLCAIVAIQGCLRMYEDVIYPGGDQNCLGAVGAWGSLMLALQLLPPTLRDDERWREVWAERLEHAVPSIVPWPDHAALDEFWAEKEIDGEAIDVPSFLIGSWRDIFTEGMADAYRRIPATKKLWMGPWLHGSPDFSPFDAVDHMPAMLRWWDRWLRDEPNGVEDEPPVALFVQYEGWRHETSWPIERAEQLELRCAVGGRLEAAGGSDAATEAWLRSTADPTVGTTAGLWEPLALGLGLPEDQGPDDVRSLCFTSEPFEEGVEITGNPVATVRVRLLDGDDATVVVKLCDVTPTGRSALITTGSLRLSHRAGHRTPDAPEVGTACTLAIPLIATSYRLAAGHRLRVAVSGADFPRIWPLPYNATVEVCAGGDNGSSITVPTIPAIAPLQRPAEPPALTATENRRPLVTDAEPRYRTTRDHVTGEVSVSTGMRVEFTTPGGDGTLELDHLATATVAAGAPHDARIVGATHLLFRRPAEEAVAVDASIGVRQATMALSGRVMVGDTVHFERTWTR